MNTRFSTYTFLHMLLGAVSISYPCTTALADAQLATQLQDSLSHSSDVSILTHAHEHINYTSCLPCHGDAAQGKQSVFAPSLAGQARWYLERQISNYQDGLRGMHARDVYGASMRAMSLLLLDEAVRNNVLDEIEAFPAPQAVQLDNQQYDLESGKERYTISCARCHGDYAEGNEAEGAPRLNALPAWYTVRQLRNFQAGIRGQHDDDTLGQEMRPMAMAVYNEHDIHNVAAYIATLQASEPKK
ncbi:c-type cytochrome [Coraliomargarita sp. SDUM461004]|uniref:C-type cytochrome n=1 Tax=Thalassobacterium sedimentorum TaxID=3041258 RepID=A0ABU1ALX1_9BACT|nr:c-type cytochrome [Coraliomargarita sp. SDUM461004]MDQ8195213.1 c-type cytochrome [Coraliomargarita sp. SDUM461004]